MQFRKKTVNFFNLRKFFMLYTLELVLSIVFLGIKSEYKWTITSLVSGRGGAKIFDTLASTVVAMFCRWDSNLIIVELARSDLWRALKTEMRFGIQVDSGRGLLALYPFPHSSDGAHSAQPLPFKRE